MLLKEENAIKRYLNVIRKLKLERTGKEERTSGRSKKKKVSDRTADRHRHYCQVMH